MSIASQMNGHFAWRETFGINPDGPLALIDDTHGRWLGTNHLGLNADSFRLRQVGVLEEKQKGSDHHWHVTSSLPIWRYEGRWQPGIIYRSRALELDDDGSPGAYHPPTPNNPHGQGPPQFGTDDLRNASATGTIAYDPQDPGKKTNGQPWDHIHNTPWVGIAVNPATQRPFIQADGPFQGFYVSTTVLSDKTKGIGDPKRYVDASRIPHLVLYKQIARLGIKQGDYAAVILNGSPEPKVTFAIVADSKGFGHGEGSRALHAALLGRAPGRAGISNRDLIFIFFPGSAAVLTTGGNWSATWESADVERRGRDCFDR